MGSKSNCQPQSTWWHTSCRHSNRQQLHGHMRVSTWWHGCCLHVLFQSAKALQNSHILKCQHNHNHTVHKWGRGNSTYCCGSLPWQPILSTVQVVQLQVPCAPVKQHIFVLLPPVWCNGVHNAAPGLPPALIQQRQVTWRWAVQQAVHQEVQHGKPQQAVHWQFKSNTVAQPLKLTVLGNPSLCLTYNHEITAIHISLNTEGWYSYQPPQYH